MTRERHLMLLAVITAGIASLLGSSLTEQEEEVPPVPVTVNYTVDSGTSLSSETDIRTNVLTGLQFGGTYPANSGAGLTLDRSVVTVDESTAFSIGVTPKTTDLLTGTATFDVNTAIDYRLSDNPTTGQFTTVLDSTTTTIVDLSPDGADVLIGAATQAVSYSWSDFVALQDDENAGLDERMASAAYNMLAVVLNAALIVEDVIADIETNRTTLEGMFNASLELTCDNLDDAGDPPALFLLWTGDPTGTGQGEIGANDSFEARFRNCRDAQRDHFLDKEILLSGYSPDRGDGLRTLAMEADFANLFVAQEAVDGGAVATTTTPRYNGALEISYVEVEATTP